MFSEFSSKLTNADKVLAVKHIIHDLEMCDTNFHVHKQDIADLVGDVPPAVVQQQIGIIGDNNNVNAINITNTNNITICCFGQEDLGHIMALSADELKAKLGLDNIPDTHTRLAKLVHANAAVPENMSVRVRDPFDVVRTTEVNTDAGWKRQDAYGVGASILCENKKRLHALGTTRPSFDELTDFNKAIGGHKYATKKGQRDFALLAKNIVRTVAQPVRRSCPAS